MPQVRRAGGNDLAAAWEIVEEYNDAIGVLLRDDRAAFQEYLTGPNALWLAEDDHEVAGCIALRPILALESGACEVKRLYVRPAYRGLGLAHALLDAAEEYARNAGYEAIYLDTFDALTVATRFYAQRGYEPIERYNDNPQATIFMKRTL